jgi:arylsulfatase A-like enzyme
MSHPRRSLHVVAAALAGTLLLSAYATQVPPAPVRVAAMAAMAESSDPRPNIVLISTDDQSASDLTREIMPKTWRRMVNQGTRFTEAMSPHPMCCPARAEILTGQYGHNSGVRHNTGTYGGFDAFANFGHADDNLGVWLSDAGYETAFIGKFLNGYEKSGYGALPGWTHWNPSLLGTYGYYETEFYNDGNPVTHGGEYVADVVADYATSYIREFAKADAPFFMWASHVGPHAAIGPYVRKTYGKRGFVPAIPAERHKGLFRTAIPPSMSKDSYNESDVSDKPVAFRTNPVSDSRITREYRRRIRALQAIDEGVAEIFAALAETNELDNTYVFFVSDNGYLLGEHRQMGKNMGFREDLTIPFVVRGPQIPVAETRAQAVSVVDLNPTFLALAGTLGEVTARTPIDSASLLPVLFDNAPVADTHLIQAGTRSDANMTFGDSPIPGWLWRGVTTERYAYSVWYTGEEALYDLERDPFQLVNLIDLNQEGNLLRDPDYISVLNELRSRFEQLKDCAGTEQCQRTFGPMPELTAPVELTAWLK